MASFQIMNSYIKSIKNQQTYRSTELLFLNTPAVEVTRWLLAAHWHGKSRAHSSINVKARGGLGLCQSFIWKLCMNTPGKEAGKKRDEEEYGQGT